MTPSLPEGASVRAGTGGAFRPDTVTLDVDGVLVDVRSSFREVVREAATTLQAVMRVPSPWTPSPGDINAFKRAGGFNDDVDLTIALTAIGAAGRGTEAAAIAGASGREGGGLAGLRRASPRLPRVAGGLALRVFDEIYWGAEGYAREFGEPARYRDGGPGLIERERPLVGEGFDRRLRDAGVRSVAVVTGRTPLEWRAAQRLLGWGAEAVDAAVTGDVVRKPDPACLDRVVGRCASRAMIYVGDVRDDWELVRRWRGERDGSVAVRGVIVGDDDDTAVYREMGADATLRRTEDLLDLLRHWARG